MVGAENKPAVRGSKVAVDRPSLMACLQPAPPPAPEDQGGFTPPTRGPLGRPESLSTPALQTRTQGSETLHGLILYRQYRWNPGLNPRHRHCVPPHHSPAPPKMTPGSPPGLSLQQAFQWDTWGVGAEAWERSEAGGGGQLPGHKPVQNKLVCVYVYLGMCRCMRLVIFMCVYMCTCVYVCRCP